MLEHYTLLYQLEEFSLWQELLYNHQNFFLLDTELAYISQLPLWEGVAMCLHSGQWNTGHSDVWYFWNWRSITSHGSFSILFFFFFNCLLAGCRDPRWMLGPKIFSVYPPPLSSKPGNSFLDCSAGLHGIHVGVLLCRYLEFSFLPSDKVRHHTCPCFSSSQNTLALPAL